MSTAIRWMLAASHLLALGIGLGAVWARSRALEGTLDAAGLKRVFHADTWWGVAAIIWIGTGLVRLFGAWEKSTGYYLENRLFWVKMALLLVILLLELAPMIALIRWRVALARGGTPDVSRAHRFAATSMVQAVLVLLMVIAATGMARGYGVAAP